LHQDTQLTNVDKLSAFLVAARDYRQLVNVEVGRVEIRRAYTVNPDSHITITHSDR